MKRCQPFYGSERHSWRWMRQKARHLLKRGIEPEPMYRTGKLWDD
jgi:hypothetical protein